MIWADYCNSLYIGLSATRLNCLDRVLRSAARLIGLVSKFDHISAYIRDILHGLPFRQRTEFRVAVLVWYSLIQCKSGLCLPYRPLSPFSSRAEHPPPSFG